MNAVSSVMETLQLFRRLISNPKFLVVKGEQFPWGWNAKGLGYECTVSHLPVFSDEELVAAVATGKSIAIPTGKPSGLFDVEFDIYRTLGSESAAKKWLVENLWRLEKLGTIVIRSPQSGFHVLGFLHSDVLDLKALTDWLWIVQECPGVEPDIIHFDSKQRPHYVMLPPSPGREFLTQCRRIREI